MIELKAGENRPLAGSSVTVAVHVAQGTQVGWLHEGDDGKRMLSGKYDFSDQGAARASTITLTEVPDNAERLRLLAWSNVATRAITPGKAMLSCGNETFTVRLDGAPRAAQLLELYRRHGAWKIRAIAAGWEAGVSALASALTVPEAIFVAATTTTAPSAPTPAAKRPVAPAWTGPSPPVEPPQLGLLLDEVLGSGPRRRDGAKTWVPVGVLEVGLEWFEVQDLVTVTATLPVLRGRPTVAVYEAAAHVSATAPFVSVDVVHSRGADAVGRTFALVNQFDSAVLKALLTATWVAATRFVERLPRGAGLDIVAPSTPPPRSLRPGVIESLESPEAWSDIRSLLVQGNSWMPPVDQPAAALAPGRGTMWVGPMDLEATPRGWAVIVEQVIASDVEPTAGLWQVLNDFSRARRLVRLGARRAPAVDGIVLVASVGFAVPMRAAVADLLKLSLDFVSQDSAEAASVLRSHVRGWQDGRDNLAWPPERAWSGPGSELRKGPLAQELLNVNPAQEPAADFHSRVRARMGELNRGGAGYLAHLALLRAEAGGTSREAWSELAEQLVGLAPVARTSADPTATASIHVRLGALKAAAARPPRTPRPSPRVQPPAPPPPPPRPTPTPSPDPPEPPRRRRWFR